MKKIPYLLSIFGIIGFIVLQGGNKTTVATAENDLQTMASVLQDENILITEWSIYAREMLEDRQSAELLAKQIHAKLPKWTWTYRDGEITAGTSNFGLYEELKIISTDTNGKMLTYVMYKAKGRSWNEETDTFLRRKLPTRLFDIFRGKATTFSCIKGEFNDKIGSALSVYKSKWLKAFNAVELEGLEEESFISISALSPLFDNSLSKENEMNLQLGLRKTERLGGKTTIVVGTPIITIEY